VEACRPHSYLETFPVEISRDQNTVSHRVKLPMHCQEQLILSECTSLDTRRPLLQYGAKQWGPAATNEQPLLISHLGTEGADDPQKWAIGTMVNLVSPERYLVPLGHDIGLQGAILALQYMHKAMKRLSPHRLKIDY
jgi:hypothetical protein